MTRDPGISAAQLRAAMGQFATGVAVVTAADARGQAYGTTANAISSLSLNPPLVLACLRRESATLQAIREARALAINVLAADQEELAERFARSAAPDTWTGVAHRRSGGLPVLDHALATLECRLHELVDGGDHVIVIGRVVATGQHRSTPDPLLFHRGAYADLVARPAPLPHPATAAPLPTGPEIALPSTFGALRMLPLTQSGTVEASVAVLVGDPRGTHGTEVYLHRGCLLGDALGSRVCRGRERLHAILERMERDGGPGVVVYHRDAAAGFGPCCLGDGTTYPPTESEQAALREAVALLGLRDAVVVGEAALECAA